MKTSRKYFPLFLSLTVSTAACTVRSVLMFLYTDNLGEYSGSKVLLYLLSALLIAAIVLFAAATGKNTKKEAVHTSTDSGFAEIFVWACVGFFHAFSILFMAFALIEGSAFFEGGTKLATLLLLIASLFCAVLCFIKASGKESKLKSSPFYSLMYIFPISWSLIRLFVLFINYSAMAIYTTEKLQILSLIVLTVYFLYEARLYYFQKPLSLRSYAVVSGGALILVPLSALPSFLKSLFINESANFGEPILCLVELAMCAYAAVSLAAALKNRRNTNANR